MGNRILDVLTDVNASKGSEHKTLFYSSTLFLGKGAVDPVLSHIYTHLWDVMCWDAVWLYARVLHK